MQELPQSKIDEIETLYNKGLFLRAFKASQELGGWEHWQGCHNRILAGKLALHSGAPALSRVTYYRVYRDYPDSPEAFNHHANTIFQKYGPVTAWQFLDKHPVFRQTDDIEKIHWYSLKGHIAALLRDFETGEFYQDAIRKTDADSSEVLFLQSNILEYRDRFADALAAAREYYAANPLSLTGINLLAYKLLLLDRSDEALEVLTRGTECTESFYLASNLVVLLIERREYAQALACIPLLKKYAPLMEKQVKKQIVSTEVFIYYLNDDFDAAITAAGQLTAPYYREIIKRLTSGAPKKRILLPLPFVKQYHKSCSPASLAALCRFWDKPVEQVDVINSICYDGTPSYKIRHWAESIGLHIREFTLTWDTACELLDRGIPFGLSTSEPNSGHFQVITGYDAIKKTLIIKDPFVYFCMELPADELIAHYLGTGPRGTLVLPFEKRELAEGIELPDSLLYDELFRTEEALARHDRRTALDTVQDMETHFPEHYITCIAQCILAGYDGNALSLLDALDRHLVHFPGNRRALFNKLTCLSELGRENEKLPMLTGLVTGQKPDPIFLREYARELAKDNRKSAEAVYWLKQALRYMSNDAESIKLTGDILWSKRAFAGGLEMYRFASCLEDKNEYYIHCYFQASRYLKQTDKVFRLLKNRYEQLKSRSVFPLSTLVHAYREMDQWEPAFSLLEQELQSAGDSQELLLFAADFYASAGRYAQAESFLKKAESGTQHTAWLKTAARLAEFNFDRKLAISLWKEILQVEPLSLAAHSTLTRLIEETEGHAAGLAYLQDICLQFPYHTGLNKLLLEQLKTQGPAAVEAACRKLLAIHKGDTSLFIILAHALWQQKRFTEAENVIGDALRIEPHNPYTHTILGKIMQASGRKEQAMQAYRKALSLAVDTEDAIYGLVDTADNLEEKRAALFFTEQELIKQTVFGDGLWAFSCAARGILDPADLLAALRAAHKERPDLWYTWSVLVNCLISLHNLDEAAELADTAAERFPLVPRIWIDLAMVKQHANDPEGELNALTRAHEVNPAWPLTSQRLALLYEKKGDPRKARDIMQSACYASPLDPYNQGIYAEILYKLGEKEKALEHVRRAVFLKPDYNWAWQHLRLWAGNARGEDHPLQIAEKLTRAKPADPQVWLRLAETCFFFNEAENGLRYADRALEIDPSFAAANVLKAEHYAAVGDFRKAREWCFLPEEQQEIPAAMHLCRARIEYREGNTEAALEEVKKLLDRHPAYEEGWELLLDCLWDRHSYNALEEAAGKMIFSFPYNPLPYGYLGAAYRKLNNTEQARQAFRSAFSMAPAYLFAGFNLYDLEMESGNTEEAGYILKILQQQQTAGNPYFMVRKIRYLAHSGDGEKALSLFYQLCRIQIDDSWPLIAACLFLEEVGLKSSVWKYIDHLVRHRISQKFNYLVLIPWVTYMAAHNKWWYLTRLENLHKPEYFPILTAYTRELNSALKRAVTQGRFLRTGQFGLILKYVIRFFGNVIRESAAVRGYTGEALLYSGRIKLAARVLLTGGNPPIDREMTGNALIALYLCGKIKQARESANRVRNDTNMGYDFSAGEPDLFRLLRIFDDLLTGRADAGNTSLADFAYDNLEAPAKILFDLICFGIFIEGKRLDFLSVRSYTQTYLQLHPDKRDRKYIFRSLGRVLIRSAESG